MGRELRWTMIGVFMLGLLAGVVLSCMAYMDTAEAEEYVYVTASVLNGREEPTKKAAVGARFDRGDRLTATGRISRDRKWVEVYAGEAGTVWVYYEYVTEETEPYTATNLNNGKVRIRKLPGGGRVTGYVRKGHSIEIDRVILGWGHCRLGWVDLEYLIVEDDG